MMPEHTITGPYEDGSYSYHGWKLIRWPDCTGFARAVSRLLRCPQHGQQNGTPVWVAEAPPEVDAEGCKRIWLAVPEARWPDWMPPRILTRHMIGDTSTPPTIEAAIDAWEAARDRLFHEALAQAVSEL